MRTGTTKYLAKWPENVDGVCVVATEGYLGAYNHLVPFKDFTALLLKCPSDSSGPQLLPSRLQL